ncbi:DMT family transporter [Halalkalibacter kiskunsagensis]|uniref:DMT family transporter n=1 Tax=Halalkalibacter kiskunsagensis TaxID=1548599 RepID=A0ABV6KD66_9BACI
MDKLYGSILVLLSAVCFGIMGILAKYAYASDVSIGTLLFFRFFIAALLFWSWILYKQIPYRQPLKQMITLFMMGTGGYALMAILLFTSYSLLPVSLAAMVMYMYPVFVVILTSLLYKHSIEISRLMAILFSLAGLYFILGTNFNQINILGIVCALGTAMVYALYIVQTEKIQNQLSPFLSSAYVTSFAAIALFLFSMVRQDFSLTISSVGWFAIFGIAFFSTFVSILTFAMGIERVGSSKAALLSIFEPVVTVMFSYFLFQDILGPMQKVGIILILVSAMLTHVSRRKIQPAKNLESSM